jgi:uncharacterized protein
MKESWKNFSVLIFAGIFLLSFVSSLNIPSHTDLYVNDFASILSPDEEIQIKDLFIDIRNQTSAEVVFVSVSDTQGLEISDYALQLASKWGVGKSDKDNGLVILYSAGTNKIWVNTGYGVEGILPDSKLGRLLDEYYVPWRDEGNVSQGIVSLSQSLHDEMISNKDELISKRKMSLATWILYSLPVIIFLIFFIGFFIFIFKFVRKQSSNLNNTLSSKIKGFKFEKLSKPSYNSSDIVKDKNAKYKILSFVFIFIADFILIFFFEQLSFYIIGVGIALIIILITSIPIRCSKDGQKMTFWKSDYTHNYYRCPEGHIYLSVRGRSSGGSSFGNSGGSSFGGGGSFGGGSFGGGGAGR